MFISQSRRLEVVLSAQLDTELLYDNYYQVCWISNNWNSISFFPLNQTCGSSSSEVAFCL